MASFFKKLGTDIGEIKNLPFTLLAFLLALLEPINRLVKVVKDLPPVVIFSGIYFAAFLLYRHINRAKEKTTGDKQEQGDTPASTPAARYSKGERKTYSIIFYLLTVLFLGWLAYFIITKNNERKNQNKLTAENEKRLEEEKAKQEERNSKINVFTAFFDSPFAGDGFSRNLIPKLRDKTDSLKMDVFIGRDSSFHEDVTGVESKVAGRISTIGFKKGIYNYGYYNAAEKFLVLRILVHNLDSCISIGGNPLPGSDCIIRMDRDIRFEFSKKIDLTADLITAILLQTSGKYASSQALFNRIAQANETAGDDTKAILFKLEGNNEMGQGNFNNAIAFYNQARQLQPGNDTITYYTAAAFAANKEYSSARAMLDRVKKNFTGKKNLETHIEVNRREFPQKGVFWNGEGYSLILNNQDMIVGNADSIQDISIKNKRYFLVLKDQKYQLYDNTGNPINTIDGQPVNSVLLNKWAPRKSVQYYRPVHQ